MAKNFQTNFFFFVKGKTICGEFSIKISNVSYEKNNFYEFLTEK